jgi:hypothetical protein
MILLIVLSWHSREYKNMNEKILSERFQLDKLHQLLDSIKHHHYVDDPVDQLWINNIIDSKGYKELISLKTDVTDAELRAQIDIAKAKIDVNAKLKETLNRQG